MSEEEKKAIEKLKSIVKVHNDFMKDIKREFISSEEIKALEIALNLIENQQKELNNLKEIEQLHKEENGKLRVELEQEKARNEKLQYKIDEKELIIDGMKEDRRIAIEEIREEYYISKDKIKEKIAYQNMLWNTPNRQKEYNQEVVEVLEELLEEK